MTFGVSKFYAMTYALLSLLLICAFLAPLAQAQNQPEDIDLSSLSWVYRMGDNIAWKDTVSDPQGWTAIDIPGEIPAKFPFFSGNILWLRTEFKLTGTPQNKVLILGKIHEADEVYLNGYKIGATGRIATKLSDYSALPVADLPRYYPVNSDRLRSGYNVLAVRAQALRYRPAILGPDIILSNGDMVTPPPAIPFAKIILEISYFTMLGLGFCLSIWVWFRRPVPSRDKWLPFLFSTLIFGSLPYSVLFIPAGWDAPFLKKISDFMPYTLFALLYLAAVAGQSLTRLQWGAMGVTYLILGLLCLPVTISWLNPLLTLLIIPLVTAFGIGILTFYNAARQGVRISLWVHVVLALTFLIIFWEVGIASQLTPNIDMTYWAIIAIAFALLMAMGDHNRWDTEKVQILTQRLLNLRELEREDIARELHDGVNQRLAASRLRLERISSRHGNAVAKDLNIPITELRETGYEIAGLVESFRPLLLESGDFGEALKQFADRLNVLGETEIALEVKGDLWPLRDTQSHLYRILQEAAYNASRHGQATRLIITGDFTSTHQNLVISDNGTGFNISKVRNGVGLTAMRERASLIGARMSINSLIDKGTTITIEGWDNG